MDELIWPEAPAIDAGRIRLLAVEHFALDAATGESILSVQKRFRRPITVRTAASDDSP